MNASPRLQRRKSRVVAFAAARRCVLVLAAAGLTGGCSLLFDSARPTPGAPRNVFCALEYRPDPSRPGEPDLLFVAGAQPYQMEEFYMSLPDMLLHMVFAPGRHLAEPVRLEGARCERPLWDAGHRLPARLLCHRKGLERLKIAVKTKWGSCSQEIPAGDVRPRCHMPFTRTRRGGLSRLSPDVCPVLPEPARDSRRGTTPSGAIWVVIAEGNGVPAELGERIDFHETVVTRAWMVAGSTHFDGEPRRALLGSGDLPRWMREAIAGMRVGEHRRVIVPSDLARCAGDPARLEADDPFSYDLELVAVAGRGGVAADKRCHPTRFGDGPIVAIPAAAESRARLGDAPSGGIGRAGRLSASEACFGRLAQTHLDPNVHSSVRVGHCL